MEQSFPENSGLKEVLQYGRLETVNKYMFDPDFIGRAFSGAFHPLIHIGYGFDFEMDGVVAEGLAMAAVSSTLMAPVTVRPTNALERVTAMVANQLSFSKPESTPKTVIGILNYLREDRELDNVLSYSMENKTDEAMKNEKIVSKIQRCLGSWEIAETSQDIEAKAKELYIACVLATGATGLRNGKAKQDFFLMHALTSVIFAYKLANTVGPSQAVSILKSHLGATLAYYVSRGRPAIDMDALLNYKGKQELDSTNPWLSVVKRAIDIDEVHVRKVVRSCAFGDLLFGAEESYSRLCINTAQMSLDLQGNWEFEGVGYKESWQD